MFIWKVNVNEWSMMGMAPTAKKTAPNTAPNPEKRTLLLKKRPYNKYKGH